MVFDRFPPLSTNFGVDKNVDKFQNMCETFIFGENFIS
jgi:hypothetical protein